MKGTQAAGRRRFGRRRRPSLLNTIRNDFLVGLAVVLPAAVTVAIPIWLIAGIDHLAAAVLPGQPAYERVVGFGVAAFLALTVGTGALARSVAGAAILARTEVLLRQVPLIRSLHVGAKQIVEAALARGPTAFRGTCLIEYPERGTWVVGVVIAPVESRRVAATGETDLVSVFVPTAPNPITGFLVLAPRRELRPLEISVEDAATIVMSAGLVDPADRKLRAEAR